MAQLKPGSHVKGTTIAELGNHNKPLDLIVYQKDGKDFLLLTNSSRGVMKIPTEKVETQQGITKKVSDTDGIAYEKIEDLKGVTQLDELDKNHALILVQTPAGAQNLETIALP
ncbi:hypothetical protein V5E97_14695 [Singulisphaera sp. Ch08]|uniref:Uncharacterized protein n=1 Tax=Singulisphaera sp. Ch08 TaxID=3120278 RepID=A0AAU7CP59_9BACT